VRFSFGDKTPKLGFYSGELLENSLGLDLQKTSENLDDYLLRME
jgi:hypothetical protein